VDVSAERIAEAVAGRRVAVSEGPGTPVWVWVASAAIVAAAGVVAAVLVASAEDDRELVGTVH
jgi:hypothetical protein